MERRALVLALALTLPLGLYGIPYAYAATTQTTYMVQSDNVVLGPDHAPDDTLVAQAKCFSPSDYTLQYFHLHNELVSVYSIDTLNSAGRSAHPGDTPNGWFIALHNLQTYQVTDYIEIFCQSPVTVAGIGVPQFGSLYVAIALGAVAYFLLARRYSTGKTKGLSALQILEG